VQEWCRQQMMKLSNKDDLTLVEFLMSCQSSGETAEYISAYLGKSPDVASFTAEFIRRKAAQLNSGKVSTPGCLACRNKRQRWCGSEQVSRSTSVPYNLPPHGPRKNRRHIVSQKHSSLNALAPSLLSPIARDAIMQGMESCALHLNAQH